MRTVRLAIVGCGRAAQSLHLPAAMLCPGVEPTVLVDQDESRARQLADSHGVAETRRDVAGAVSLADAALVALPHHLHAGVTRELLEAGLHVLVEKPLALTAAECEELAELAARRNLVLAVGMVRRWFPAARFVKQALERGLLGPLHSVSIREGVPFSWDVASDFTFRRETGGGVLADAGVHLLDLLSWWFGVASVKAYRDDAFGGVEANCEIELELEGGVGVQLELSRTRQLRNSVIIEGSRGVLEAGTLFGAEVRFDLGADSLSGAAHREKDYRNVRELFVEQLEDFVRAVGQASPPAVDGRAALPAIALLEECRSLREPLHLPWLEVGGEVAA